MVGVKVKMVRCQVCGLECDGKEAWMHFKCMKHNLFEIILPKKNRGTGEMPERNEKGQFVKGHKGYQHRLGKHCSEEAKRKMSEAKKKNPSKYWLGKHLPEEMRKQISENLIGRTDIFTQEVREKLSKAHKGRIVTEETKSKISGVLKGNTHAKGKKHSEEAKHKIGKANKGENNGNWKGGISPINKRIRKSIEFRLWREAVFARDNWVCQICGQRRSNLHPHHLKKFTDYPELRFIVDNGMTLCEFCHKTYTDFGNQYTKKPLSSEREYLNNGKYKGSF